MKNELVKVINNEVVTNSVIVADMFGKKNQHIVRDIEAKLNRDFNQSISGRVEISKEMISKTKSALSKMYHETTYKDKKGENRKMYIMNRDGALNLIMGYTGDLAEVIRVQFINAFNEMEKQLESSTKEMSTLDMVALIATKAAKQEREQLEMKKRQNEMLIEQQTQKAEINQLKSQITTSNTDYYTIAGYATLIGKNVDVRKASAYGKQATKLSKQLNYPISKAHSEIFGAVNTYHKDILKVILR